VGFVEVLTVAHELWSDSYVTSEIELADVRNCKPILLSNQKFSFCCRLSGHSASDCNVDVTGDVTVKCHDTAFSQCCHFAVSRIILWN
jgi:hypothetical protein